MGPLPPAGSGESLDQERLRKARPGGCRARVDLQILPKGATGGLEDAASYRPRFVSNALRPRAAAFPYFSTQRAMRPLMYQADSGASRSLRDR